MIEALYIHIPFCLSKCPYCAFNSFAGFEPALIDEYVEVISRQIRQRLPGSDPLKSIFFGGGTPTILSTINLQKIFDAVGQSCSIAPGAEITVEANPRTVSAEKLELLLRCGVNRLSIGVQSFDDNDLRLLQRPYNAADVDEIISLAAREGFTNLSIDLMYGIPGQTVEVWKKNLAKALSVPVKHLSMYQLTIEEGTPFERWYKANQSALPDEDAVEEMDNETARLTEEKAMSRYEISNYAQRGFHCRHNKVYWRNEPYWGVGAGAVEYINGERRWYEPDPAIYVKKSMADALPLTVSEKLEREESFRETVIMGLRMVEGVSTSVLAKRFGIDAATYYGDKLKRLIDLGMIEYTRDYLRLTENGMKVANSVMAELV